MGQMLPAVTLQQKVGIHSGEAEREEKRIFNWFNSSVHNGKVHKARLPT